MSAESAPNRPPRSELSKSGFRQERTDYESGIGSMSITSHIAPVARLARCGQPVKEGRCERDARTPKRRVR
jgi:hypothetical protein